MAAGSTTGTLQSLIYQSGGGDGTTPQQPSLQVLDQLLLPDESKYVDVTNLQSTWSVIRNMQIRGAPLIAVVAVLGLTVDLYNLTSQKELDAIEQMNGPTACGKAILAYIQGKMDYLATSRPTAVNLFNALNELKDLLQQALTSDSAEAVSVKDKLLKVVKEYSEFALERDRQDNRRIGKYGADEILSLSGSDSENKKKLTMMTICNTGSLATSDYGTALGVVRAIHERGQLGKIVALETRPYNQGSRLTSYEMVVDQLPNSTLICDSMAAAMMRIQGVDAIVVGADRICANGDTANKIGTYSLSVLAQAHNVPFYVAAPVTTLDPTLESGNDVVIEERPPSELLETSRAPKDINVWNPAFDITPAKYITGIITDKGVIKPSKMHGTIDVVAFLNEHAGDSETTKDAAAGDSAPSSSSDNKQERRRSSLLPVYYTEQTVDSLPQYLAKSAPEAMARLGTKSASDLECVEVGDGNLNLVFIVTNKTNRSLAVIVKQALPYVRCVGESWPLTLDRAYFEYNALTAEFEACPQSVPVVYHFSRPNGLMVMEYLAPPMIILRKGLIQGIRYPSVAKDIGIFCAQTLFRTSGFRLTPKELRAKVEFWSSNSEMCELTEKVIFTEPYIEAPLNRWTTPQLDGDKQAIENDTELVLAAERYKNKFITETQALIHGDLHTGSIMCMPEEGKSYVIDPEFAYYGPMGFDTGAFVANLFLAYVSQPGHNNGSEYAEWILQQIDTFWNVFTAEFKRLWEDPSEHTGYLYARAMDNESFQDQYLNDVLLSDTIGFAGMKMLRRIVGIAHVEDLESIKDADLRATCERRGLEIAKAFIKRTTKFSGMQEAIQIAREKAAA